MSSDMSIRGNFKALYDDADEYVKRSIDSYKLLLVESLSLLYGDVACGFVLFMLLFLALIIMLVAIVALMAPVIGLVVTLFIAAGLIVTVAFLVYIFKIRLFVNGAVKRICRIFFVDDNEEE